MPHTLSAIKTVKIERKKKSGCNQHPDLLKTNQNEKIAYFLIVAMLMN